MLCRVEFRLIHQLRLATALRRREQRPIAHEVLASPRDGTGQLHHSIPRPRLVPREHFECLHLKV